MQTKKLMLLYIKVMLLKMLFVHTILFALFAQVAHGEDHYHIVPAEFISLCQHHPKGSCFTLDTFPSKTANREKGNITLNFHPGEHLLTRNINFHDMNSITLVNVSNMPPRISCIEDTGFTISSSDTVIIKGLVVYECLNWGAVLSFYDVRSLYIEECDINENVNKSPICEHSSYSGTTCIVRTKAVIKNCIFKSNSVYNPTRYQRSCFSDNPGGGAVYVKDSAIEIDSCLFESNSVRNAMYFTHGGALMITGSVGTIINTNFSNNQVENLGGAIFLKLYAHTTKGCITISKCNFDNNVADFGGAIYADSNGTLNHANINMDIAVREQGKYGCKCSENVFSNNVAHTYGGVVYSLVSMSFESDIFKRNWAARDGGAIMFTGPLVTVNMSNCVFTDHKLRSMDNSMIVGHSIVVIITNIIVANNSQSIFLDVSHAKFYGHCRFFNNRIWQKGGALFATGSTIIFDNSSLTEIKGNEANFGGGLYLKDSTVTVYGDMLIQENNASTSGGGIYAHQSVIEFVLLDIERFDARRDSNYINISQNLALERDGGGMYLSTSRFDNVMRIFTISDNHANRFGGGLFLISNSKINMKLRESSRLIFLHLKANSALKGGGIYVSDKSSSQDICDQAGYIYTQTKCFVEPSGNRESDGTFTVSIYFENNTAVETGSEIYGGLLDRCLIWGDWYTGNKFMQQSVGWTWGNQKKNVVVDGHPCSVYTSDTMTDFYNHISSDPMKVCFCVDNIVNCTLTHLTLHKKKGETFTLSLVAVDQVGKPVNASLYSLVNLDGRKGALKVGQQFRTLPDRCTELEYNVYDDRNKTVLELYPDGPCGNQGISKQEIHISFDPCTCPLGFEQLNSSTNCSCDCTEALKSYIKHCWQEEKIFQLNDKNWIQNVNNTGFVLHDCPFDFCLKESVSINLSETSDIQCAFNRTGIMCGKCDQGLSMVFATSQCQQCSNHYTFLFLPFGIAGVALVAFILFLNMTVATGTIHGLIFYANILVANRSVFIPLGRTNILTVFVSWLNLDLGIETCFYNGMDSYGKLMLQLVFPAYVFFLIIIIIVLCDRSQRMARLFGKRNPEATLYTLFLLSYSKLLRVVITALQYTTLDYPDGSKEIVWLYDANVKYFALNHIPRFLAAFIITILGAVYTSLLLFGQLFNKCSEYRIMKWISHKYYIHFTKAHHAPLSDNHRYWVGLLLLARLTQYLISAFTNELIVVLSVMILTLLILVHKIVFNSYSKTSVNLLETQFILNLSVLAGTTLFVQLFGGDQESLAIVSMSFSFSAFLGIVLYHILDICAVKLKNWLTKILPTHERNRDNIDYRPVAITESEDENTEAESDEELIELSNMSEENATIEPYDPTHYITPPVIRTVLRDDQLREPLLDDLYPLTPADYKLPPIPITKQRKPRTATEIVVKENLH